MKRETYHVMRHTKENGLEHMRFDDTSPFMAPMEFNTIREAKEYRERYLKEMNHWDWMLEETRIVKAVYEEKFYLVKEDSKAKAS